MKAHELNELAQKEGLALVGIANISRARLLKEKFVLWQGLHSADLKYMQREPDAYFNPEQLLPECKSLLVFAAFYESVKSPPLMAGYGRVARYAWGRDYHRVLKKAVMRVADTLQRESASFRYRVFTDAVPLVERAFAHSAGIGFFGKNSMLIRPKLGSFFLIAELLTNLELTPNDRELNYSCGQCTRCMKSCPTNAIVEPYVVDSKRCISYLTIEKRGVLEVSERRALGEWLFGCDICQEVCPFNHTAQKSKSLPLFSPFSQQYGVGPLLELRSLFAIQDDAQFLKRFAGTPLMRAKRRGLLRNAICVAHNTQQTELLDDLERILRFDCDQIVRAHALWAYVELARSRGVNPSMFLKLGRQDQHLVVREEAQRLDNVT